MSEHEPKKNLYQARAVLRRQRDFHMKFGASLGDEYDGAKVYHSKCAHVLGEAVELLGTYGLDMWARLQREPRGDLSPSIQEMQVNFTELDPT